MATAQSVLVYLQDCLHEWDKDSEDKIYRAINTSARSIARYHSWTWLRRTVAITQGEDATQGHLMPANMIGVIGPIVDSNGYIYQQIDPTLNLMPPSPCGRYWMFDPAPETPILDSTAVSINNNSKALSFSPALAPATYTGDYDGEFIALTDSDGNDMGLHEMASASALENTYWGPRINGGHYTIRPSTCRRLSFLNEDAERIAVVATVNYWVYPEPLVARHISFPDHWENALKLGAWLEVKLDTVDQKGETIRIARGKEYDIELAMAKQMDGNAPTSAIKRDIAGNVRRFGWR